MLPQYYVYYFREMTLQPFIQFEFTNWSKCDKFKKKSKNPLHPVSTKNRYSCSPNVRKGKKEKVNESMNDRKDILFFYYSFIIFYHQMSHDVSRFPRSAQHSEPGEDWLLNERQKGGRGPSRLQGVVVVVHLRKFEFWDFFLNFS